MRKFVALAGLILFVTFSAAAQDTSKIQINGGFLYSRGLDNVVSPNCAGGYGQATFFVIGGLGATANFGGCSYTGLPSGFSAGSFEYVFGPTYAWLSNRAFEPFVQGLVGGASLSLTNPAGTTASVNGFALNAGGGLDVRVTDDIAIRVIQVNWLLAHGAGATENAVELKFGVTLRLGGSQ